MDNLFNYQENTINLFARLGVNVLVLYILLYFIYYPYNGKRKLYFTYFMIGLIVFIISSFLGMVEIKMGFALGLFAIFSIIRYRTPPVEIKDMTYLFLVIGIAVSNALVHFDVFWRGIITSNIVILLCTFLLEKYKPKKKVLRRQLVYTPLDFSMIGNMDKIKKELETLLNMPLLKVTVEKINLTKGELTVIIYYKPESMGEGMNNINHSIKYNH